MKNLNKPCEWFYVNLWPGHDHMADSVSIAPEVDFAFHPAEICLSLNVDTLIAITEFIKEVTDIEDLRSILEEENNESK